MKGIRIRPEQQGLRTSLFDLEAEIMEIIWDLPLGEFAVSDVHDALQTQRTIAYTTVMTTISRLFDKELLTRHKEGRRYLYRALLTRAQFISAMTQEVLNSLPPVGKEVAMAHLVEHVANADDDELARLEALIQKRRQQT